MTFPKTKQEFWQVLRTHKVAITDIGLILLLIVFFGFFGGYGGMAVMLCIGALLLYRLYSTKQMWWTPFKESTEMGLFGKLKEDMTKEERLTWKRSPKSVMWNNKEILVLPGKHSKERDK